MSLCGRMFEILRKLINLSFPKEIEKPECVLRLLEAIYPTVDWSKVRFYDGLPWFARLSQGTNAITLPGKYGLDSIHIYFQDFNPCTCEGMGTIIHEGFHVLQYNDIGTFGVGWIRPFMIQYFACCFKLGKDCYDEHPMENGAYDFEDDFLEAYCYDGKPKYQICDIKAILDAICKWTTTWEEKCVDWAKETKEECEKYRDDGYEDCAQWKEEKKKQCCTWWPCSWFCKAWVWIVSTICVAWIWVSSLVCIAWVTIVSWVCKATAWVIKAITCW